MFIYVAFAAFVACSCALAFVTETAAGKKGTTNRP
jgi:hypothetical protein